MTPVVDTDELSAPAPPEPRRPSRRRVLLLLLAYAVIVAAVGVLVSAVRASEPSATSGSAPVDGPGDASSEQRRDTNDPLRPQVQATLDPGTGAATEAALRRNWPLIANDEFDGTAVDEALWNPYSGRTTDDVGQHVPGNLSVSDGTLKITSRGYETGGMAWNPGQLYGRWEVRARTQPGTGYGPVVLLWPDAEDWPEGGEINFMEIPSPARGESHFVLHYGEDNSQVGTSTRGDFTQWRTYAVEWTPDHVAGFIDGQEIFRTDDAEKIPPRPMHLAIQQDIGPFGKDWIPPLDETTPEQVQLEVDWVRIYGL